MSLSSSRKKNLFMFVFGLKKKNQNRSESNWVYGFDPIFEQFWLL